MNSVSPSVAPAAVVMGAAFLALGLSMILQPGHIRKGLDRLGEALVESANLMSGRQHSWHPCEMSDRGLGLAGVIVIAGATLFFYTAYLALLPSF
jgi:hypothetical protein